VWIGSFESEDDLRAYVREGEFSGSDQFTQFCADLGVRPPLGFYRDPPPPGGEGAAARFTTRTIGVRELIRLVPFAGIFADDAAAVAEQFGVVGANAVVCVYNFDFYGRRAEHPLRSSGMRYLGSFRFRASHA